MSDTPFSSFFQVGSNFKIRRKQGFALVITLSLMILLTILAVGLLSLSSISLRNASRQAYADTARANARLAVMLALGELQKHAGDDRRITADGSILQDASHPNAVGIWKSWSPKQIESPAQSAPNYSDPKATGFETWLVSSEDPAALQSKDWAKSGTLADPVNLFTTAKDGFDLAGSKVEVKNSATPGSLAWVVSQAATKAKINVAGPEDDKLVANDSLQAQPRPTLGITTSYKNPAGGWNLRANRVISMSQAKLDKDLWDDATSVQDGANFTTVGFGLLSDVVNGGMKTDLNLGFELSDSDFESDTWSGVKNPFRYANAPELGNAADVYKGQRPLFSPSSSKGLVTANLNYSPANVFFQFPAAAVPTFTTLRSFYRTPYHLYNTTDGATVFERGMDHVSLKKIPRPPPGTFDPPPNIPPAAKTQIGYRPVLDRVLFVMSVGLGADNRVRLVLTPIVTLWNPYNTALEIEGAVAYPWVDVPFHMDWRFVNASGTEDRRGMHLSHLLGEQFRQQGHGRSVNPYFYAAITSDGQPGATSPIRFQPGEVRVFAPMSQIPTDFPFAGSIRQRTVFLQPVSNPNQLSARGGFAVPMYNPVRGEGFNRDMLQTDKVEITFKPGGENNPFFIALEDATRAKLANPTTTDRGQAITDIQTRNFTTNDNHIPPEIRSKLLTHTQISTEPQPFAVIETYHRTALDSASGQRSDLVFTNNPRQQFINHFLAQGNFKTGPHYETKVRAISSFSGLIESLNGNSFYGASNTSQSGRTHLSFFEVPRAPMLSLAGFQHADLSFSAYSPANQFANSWASAYLPRNTTEQVINANGVHGLPVVDYPYLANEALWDSFFFSGAAPDLKPGSISGSPSVWDSPIANVTRSLNDTIGSFVRNPDESPMRNPRFRLHRGEIQDDDALINTLTSPAGCTKIAAHLLVDGAFNINSTSVEAWAAFLGGMRGRSFDVINGSSPGGSYTAITRFRNPIGKANDNWQGFRSISDAEISSLATNMVNEVRKRGPFLSLGEFVNRRIEESPLGLSGAIQSAIDASGLNKQAMMNQQINTSEYPVAGRNNIVPSDTGVGIPGYLTQADVLQSIGPVITPRSDTFTIRGYGEARDKSGNTIAKVWCEAVVQRCPEFVDASNPPSTAIADLSPTNQAFGRRFSIVSFRYLPAPEIGN